MENETKVREAASALREAIKDAKTAGYDVQWPSQVEGLDHIAISETAKVGAATGVPLVGVEVPADGIVRETTIGDPNASPAVVTDTPTKPFRFAPISE